MKKLNKLISTFFSLSSFALFTACSDDTTDVASVMDEAKDEATLKVVSFEGENYYDVDLNLARIRFVGAHTAYATMDMFKNIADGEVLCEYSAIEDTMTLQVQKVPAVSGGPLLTEQEFILFWNGDDWRREYIGYHDGVWAGDDFETETKDVKTEKTKESDNVKITLTTSGKLKDSIEDSVQVLAEFTAVIKNVTVEKGTKTTTTITRKYTEDVAEWASEFYTKYKMLSDDDWKIVHNMFLPFKYSFARNVSVAIDFDEGEKAVFDYDLVLTQHYTERGNAAFVDVAEEGTGFRLSYFSLSTGEIVVSQKKTADEEVDEYVKDTYYKYVSGDSDKKTFTFEEFKVSGTGSSDEETSTGTITAKYSVEEKGDSTTLSLQFETKNGFYLSGKTIDCRYVTTTYALRKE